MWGKKEGNSPRLLTKVDADHLVLAGAQGLLASLADLTGLHKRRLVEGDLVGRDLKGRKHSESENYMAWHALWGAGHGKGRVREGFS